MDEKKPENLVDLRIVLCEIIEDLRNGNIDTDKAKTISYCADVVIKTIKCQLDMHKSLKKVPNIKFLEEGK